MIGLSFALVTASLMPPGELQASGEKRVLTRSHQSLLDSREAFSCCCEDLRGAAAVPGPRLPFECHPSPSRARGVPLCSSSERHELLLFLLASGVAALHSQRAEGGARRPNCEVGVKGSCRQAGGAMCTRRRPLSCAGCCSSLLARPSRYDASRR